LTTVHDFGSDGTIVTGAVEKLIPDESITIDGQTYPLASAANVEPEVEVGEQVQAIIDHAGLVTFVSASALAEPPTMPAAPVTTDGAAPAPEPHFDDAGPPEDLALAPPAAPPAPPAVREPRPASEPEPNEELQMTLIEHLEELRQRLIKSVIALFIATIVSLPVARYVVLPALIALLPEGTQIQALKPTEQYVEYFKVSLMCGLALAMPVIVYQFFAFVNPGLTRQERRWAYLVAPGAGLLFVVGLLFAYFVILPFGLPILGGFLSDIVVPGWALEYYITFVVRFLIITGLVFQTPLIIFFLSKLGVISQERLARSRRYAIVIAAAAAALLTPTTDPFTMLLVMGPMILLYEVGILLARFF
jgi:sec-independent protein translocase protein TatC